MALVSSKFWTHHFTSVVIVSLVLSAISSPSWISASPQRPWPNMSLVTSSHWIDLWSSVDQEGNLRRYIEHEEIRLKVISQFENNSKYEDEIPFVKRRIEEFKLIHEDLVKNASNTAYQTSLKNFHPITIFASIRNFLATWDDKLKNHTVYGRRLREFLEYNIKVPLPKRQDLEKIGTAITVIQATYNLSMNDLLQGNVLGQSGEVLTRSDCFDIGKTVLKAGLLDTATEWLETAIRPIDLNNIDQSKVTFDLAQALASLAKIAFRKNDPDKAVRLYEKAVEIEPDNEELYKEYMMHRFSRNLEPIMELNREKVEPWRKTFFDTCHNTTRVSWLEEQRKNLKPNVRCRWRKSWNVPIMFYKEEVLSSAPFISMIYDFLSEHEITTLRNRTLDQLEEKILPGEDPKTLWVYKGSTFGDSYDAIIERVSKRAGDVAGMDTLQRNTSYSLGEPLQVIDYGISGLSLPQAEVHRKYEVKYMGIIYGARYATVQAFLSDTELGGASVFLEQNVTVIPRKGSALLWYNFKPIGDSETELRPATCPLLVGENIVIEKGFWRLGLDPKSKCGRKRKSSNMSVMN